MRVRSSPALAANGRGRRARAWVAQHPLALCLPLQALLLLADLGHLPLWGDEQTSLDRALRGVVPSNTVHPDLYFALLRGWLAAVGGGLVGSRALSALFALAATVAIDRSWLRDLDRRARGEFLCLWTLSPALLLYGRMARSYSLQLLLACLALAAGRRYARHPAPTSLLAYAAACTALLHTHYLPAIAVTAGVGLAMCRVAVARRQPAALATALAPVLLIAVGFAPWLPALAGAAGRVTQHHGYHLIGPLADAGIALLFTAVSFSVGECLWPWTVAALPLLAPALAMALWRGLRRAQPDWLAMVVPAALIGFAGALQWVSYAFVPARLLFLLPFFLLLIVQGARASPRLGPALISALAACSLAGAAAYFAPAGFLNQAYVIPTATIADAIRAGSPPGPVTVLLDAHSTDLAAVAAQLPPDARIVYVADAAGVARATALADAPSLDLVWFARSTHDVSPARWNARVTEAFARHFTVRRRGFAPYSALDRWLMRRLGRANPPHFAVELQEMRRDGGR